jgi:hypothetical protein
MLGCIFKFLLCASLCPSRLRGSKNSRPKSCYTRCTGILRMHRHLLRAFVPSWFKKSSQLKAITRDVQASFGCTDTFFVPLRASVPSWFKKARGPKLLHEVYRHPSDAQTPSSCLRAFVVQKKLAAPSYYTRCTGILRMHRHLSFVPSWFKRSSQLKAINHLVRTTPLHGTNQ